ncbi:MAG: hemerythrin family protein [Nitrospirae bacterium]|nr:hemerythrin family protein [Nitrospirota bacterium]
MPLITWSDSLSVHIKEVDSQHQRLVQLVNDVFDAVNAKKGNDILKKVLNELIDYTKYHFATEERLMNAHDYPERVKHKEEHDDLTKQVLDFQKKFKEGKAMLDILLMNFLKEWLIKHIIGSDKKFGPYLNSKGVS